MVTFVSVPSAGISSVADDSAGKAQGHDRRGDQEDNQAELASGVAPGLAHQPTQNDANVTSPTSLIRGSLLEGRSFLTLGRAGPHFELGSSPPPQWCPETSRNPPLVWV
jgi:hypothetical protein